VDELGCQKVGFERDNEFTSFRVNDERGDDDVGIDDQLHSSKLLRFLFGALACALVDSVGDVGDIALGEFTSGREFVHHLECLDFFLDGLSGDLAPVDLRVSLHPVFEVVVDIDGDTGHTRSYVYTEYCVIGSKYSNKN